MRVRHDQFVSSDLREPLHPQRVIVSGKRGLLEETSELLVPTSCPVPIWWKVRATVGLTVDSNPAIRRTMSPGSQLWQRFDHPIQGSSVASERAFFSAGLDDDKRCGEISANNVGCLQFVKAHCRGERHREIVAKKLESDVQRAAWIDT